MKKKYYKAPSSYNNQPQLFVHGTIAFHADTFQCQMQRPVCFTTPKYVDAALSSNRVGQSREIYSNSVPLSPPHWPYPKRIRPPSWPRVAVASSIQNTKLFTWRTWPGAGAVPKCDWAARSQCGFKQRRADHTKYIWYVATHGQSVNTTELMIA